MEPLLLDTGEACRVLKVSRTTLYALMANGNIEVVHIGKLTRITAMSLQAYVDGLTRGVQAEAATMMRRVVRGLSPSVTSKPARLKRRTNG
jgi:excisionase family DNA binding protein